MSTIHNQTLQRKKAIVKATWVGFWVNLLLSIGKVLAGIIGRSNAMVADGIHSMSDFLTDLVVLVFIKISSKPKDDSHDYGHGKYETLASVIIGILLAIVGVGILINSIAKIRLVFQGVLLPRPGIIALVAAFVSIGCKEALYWYTIGVARRYNSPVVKANAWHHRSDAFSSAGTLVGIAGAYFLGNHWRILDPIAAVFVSLLIGKVAYDLIRTGVNDLLECSLPKEDEEQIEQIVANETLFTDLHNLKTRRIGAYIAIEFHVRVPGTMTVQESHGATERVEQQLKAHFGSETQVIVHVEPEK